MPFDQLMNVHTVDVLEPAITAGRGFGVHRNYAAVTRQLTCRVVPLDPSQEKQLTQEGYVATHRVWFTSDPQIGLRTRIRYPAGAGGTVMRMDVPKHPPANLQAWVALATAKAEDNLGLLEPA